MRASCSTPTQRIAVSKDVSDVSEDQYRWSCDISLRAITGLIREEIKKRWIK